METPHIVILGAGVAGLTCAAALEEAGISYEVFEAAEQAGGRVVTGVEDGFLLDRGFQVLPTAYPAVRRWLKPRDLELRAFQPGALVRIGERFFPFHDISRLPLSFLGTLISPVGGLGDKLRLRRLRNDVLRGEWQDLFSAPETTALEFLRSRGFSERVIQRFFRPFFGGIFLDRELSTSSRMLTFTLRMFTEGAASLPARGMQQVVKQLATRLPPEALHFGKRVSSISHGRVQIEGGGAVMARKIVIATDGASASRLDPRIPAPRWRSTTCFYYAFRGNLGNGGFLMLNGDSQGPINHAAILSEVVPEYAPRGQSLICANIVGDAGVSGAGLEAAVRGQLAAWLRVASETLRLLRVDEIPSALPVPAKGSQKLAAGDPQLDAERYVCGDHWAHPSLQGAMDSGQAVAERIIRESRDRGAGEWTD